MFRLTSDIRVDLSPNLQHFQIGPEMKIKLRNFIWMLILPYNHQLHRCSNVSSKMINDIEALSLARHGVNNHFTHQPYNAKNYSISHKSDTNKIFQTKTFCIRTIYFYIIVPIYGSKFKIQNYGQKSSLNKFDI